MPAASRLRVYGGNLRSDFSLRRGEGLKYVENLTKNEDVEASFLAGERYSDEKPLRVFGEGFLKLVELTFT
ncbi:hypothetical protein CLI64_21810 [Nostoc sp. CENA543]|nr:hypothetical protein CLI64_21810 [Nostoc sp. CENA543]